jgi:hypothetical protein
MSASNSQHERETTHTRRDHQKATRSGDAAERRAEHQAVKELEKENARLKRLVADLSLDKAMLKELVEGKW